MYREDKGVSLVCLALLLSAVVLFIIYSIGIENVIHLFLAAVMILLGGLTLLAVVMTIFTGCMWFFCIRQEEKITEAARRIFS